ncbi:MAG TPA: PAS domain S-box protein [Trueperaceae bacterium]|nr:PAS domain S-box protein [Trueperaceae bacterium]
MTETVAFTLSPDGRAATWSAAVGEAFGYAAHEFIGRPFTELFAPGDDAPDRVVEQALADGHAVIAGWRVGKSGRRSLVSGSLTLLVEENGRPYGIAVALRDVTGEMTQERPAPPTPEEDRDLVAQAVWTLPETFYVLDPGLRVVYLNEASERQWGMRRDDVLGRHLADVFPDLQDSELLQRHIEVVAHQAPVRFEAFSPVRGRTVEVLLLPLRGGVGALVRDPFEHAMVADQRRVNMPTSSLEVSVQRYVPTAGHLAESGGHTDVFGLPDGEALAGVERKLALVLPAERRTYELVVRNAVERGEPWQTQYRIKRPRDGAVAWLAESSTVERSEGDLAYVVMTWDVTALRRVEEQLRAGSRRLRRELLVNRHLYEVITRAGASEDPREGVETLLRAALDLVGGPRGGVWLLDKDRRKLTVFAQTGFKGAYLAEFGVVPVEEATIEEPTSGLALRDVPPHHAAALAEDGVDAQGLKWLSLPLVGATGQRLGALCLHAEASAPPNARDYYALKMLAMQMSALIDRQQLDARSSELMRRLEEHARLAGEALLESELMFRRAFELGPVAAVITTRDEDRFLEVNDWYLKLTGYERDEVVGRTARELGMWSSPEDRQRLESALRAGGRFNELELRLRTKDGHVRDILLSGEEIHYAGQRCMLKMFKDVTEQHRSQEELLTAIREVMSDAEWFSRSVVQRLAEMRHGEPGSPEDVDLTPREREVLEYVAAGLSDDEVAARLGISQRTARNHLTNTYAKIGAHNRAEAIVWARERGLVARLG